jgi:U6 snRNA-associated Sm-like protein LSm5
MANRILPLELIDKAVGSQMWILLRGTKEVVGTLRGFDDYVSRVIITLPAVNAVPNSLAHFDHCFTTGQLGIGRCH